MKSIICFLLSVLFLLPCSSPAYEKVGYFDRVEGEVSVKRKAEGRRFAVKKGYIGLYKDDVVTTGDNGKAWIVYANDSKIIMLQNSKLDLKDIGHADIKTGKILVSFEYRHSTGLRIRFRACNTVIGVKGTRFMVDVEQNGLNIVLESGNLQLEAIKGSFWEYRKQQQDEFEIFKTRQKRDYESFKDKQQEEFERYSQQQEKELKRYFRQFEIQAGQTISIQNNQVTSTSISDDDKKLFRLLDQWK